MNFKNILYMLLVASMAVAGCSGNETGTPAPAPENPEPETPERPSEPENPEPEEPENPGEEKTLIYFNDFDRTEATQTGGRWPSLNQFDGWRNETGAGAAAVEYEYEGVTARANSNSNGKYSDYEGSGVNNLFFGADAHFQIQKIALGAAENLRLTFGTEKYDYSHPEDPFDPEEFRVYVSNDGVKWVALEYGFEGGTMPVARWNVASASFTVPAETGTLSLYFAAEAASMYRIDDVTLTQAETAGTAIDFTQGTEVGSGPAKPGDEPENHGQVDPKAVKWLELPATDAEDLDFFTHFMGTQRSYSFYWDDDALVAHWVAYPLNAGLIGSGSRSEQWGLDPLLPESRQPVLYRAFSGGWSRGHQIPSADRYGSVSNVQTFYFTNMTPQDYNFNGGIWAQLENKVREWARKSDTLYVVTGCLIEGSVQTAYDNNGKAVTVPTAYYKALLRYVQDAGYSACAFCLSHDHDPNGALTSSLAISVDELEEMTGEDFFVNLPEKAGAQTAADIEAEDPKTVPWWWQ